MKVNSVTTEELDSSGRVTGTSNRKFNPKPHVAVGANVWDTSEVDQTIKEHLVQSKERDALVTIRTSQGKFHRVLRRLHD